MADEEINVTVNADADLSSLEALEDMIDDIESKASSAGLELENAFSGVDSSSVDDVASSADDASGSLDGMADSAGDAAEEVKGINPSGVKETGDSASNSASDLDTLASSAAAAGSVVGLEEMANTAGNISDSYKRLDLTFGGVTKDMKADISSASEATGRSGGTVREYFNMMGIAGVKNSNLLSSSFQSIAGRAYQTNQPIEQVENSVQRMVLTGKAGSRQLMKLGISAEQLGAAMGVSGDQAEEAFSKLSQEERLKVLTKAMGDGKKANEDYGNSWQGVKEKGGAAMAGLLGAIGGPMLSVLIPALSLLTSLVNGVAGAFKLLPGPVQLVVGGVLAAGMVFIALVGSLGMVGKALSGIRTGLQTLGIVEEATEGANAFQQLKIDVKGVASSVKGALTTAVNGAKTAFTAMKEAVLGAARSLWNYVKAAWSSVTSAIQSAVATMRAALAKLWEAIQTVYNTIVKALNTIATYALVVAEYLLAAPILLVVIAVIAAVAILWYLYNTNTQVKATIDWLIASFWNFLSTCYAVFMGVVSAVMGFAAGVWAGMMNAWNGVLGFLGWVASLPGRLWAILMEAIQRVLSFASSFVSNLRSAASRGVTGFINGLKNLVSSLASELSEALNHVIEWGSQIVAKFGSIAQEAWSAFVNGLGIGSPGYIAINTKQELERVSAHADDYGGTFKSKFEALGSTVSDSYLKGNGMVTNLPNSMGAQPTGNTININIEGNVRDDATIEEIVKGVTKAISWNNTLAGRTIGDSNL